jgi:RNA polymerase sigma-70 factor (ECF subfamily)
MEQRAWLVERFEEHRPRLRAVAYRMLGSLPEAEDAVQDAWVKVSRAGADDVDNLAAWLTTVVSRVCLNMLRARNVRREDRLGPQLPDPIVTLEGPVPEEQALMADSVGLALQVVLDTLAPAERLAFVLHDMFDLPFEEIAPMVGRSVDATRQLASRARRRVRGADQRPTESDVRRQRAVVDAFFAAARGGDFDALVAVLDPDVVLHSDLSPGRPSASRTVRGAARVARQAKAGAHPRSVVVPALVNGAAGAVVTLDGRPHAVIAFTVAGGRIVEIDVIADRGRVARVAAEVLAAG